MRKAQDPRLPELDDPRPELLLVARAFELAPEKLAPGEQVLDRVCGVENASALHLGRMSRQHRRHEARLQCFAGLLGRDAGFREKLEGEVQTAILKRRRPVIQERAAADAVAVLRDVRQVREVAEGARDGDGLLGPKPAQKLVQLAAGVRVGLMLEGDAEAEDRVDQIEGFRAFLLLDRFLKQPRQKANVIQEAAFQPWKIVQAKVQRINHGAAFSARAMESAVSSDDRNSPTRTRA